MSETLTFTVEGTPKGKPRPRAAIGKTRAHVYDSGTDKVWVASIRAAAKAAAKEQQWTHNGEALSLVIVCYFMRPKSHFRKDGWSWKKSAPREHVQKPDVDNLVKSISDAIVSCEIIKDDCYITQAFVQKRWSTYLNGVDVRVSKLGTSVSFGEGERV